MRINHYIYILHIYNIYSEIKNIEMKVFNIITQQNEGLCKINEYFPSKQYGALKTDVYISNYISIIALFFHLNLE